MSNVRFDEEMIIEKESKPGLNTDTALEQSGKIISERNSAESTVHTPLRFSETK